MEKKVSICRKRIWMKLKYLMIPTRVRKLLHRSNMKNMKMIVSGLIVFSSLITLITYYWNRSPLQTHRYTENITQLWKITSSNRKHLKLTGRAHGTDDTGKRPIRTYYTINPENEHLAKLIDTEGCKIPRVIVDYSKYIKNYTKKKGKCGKRGVILLKYDDNTVLTTIKNNILIKYLKNKRSFYDCCYQFILKAVSTPALKSRRKRLIYSNCTKFEHNSRITLQSDFINVQCFEYMESNTTRIIYDDMYAFVKKIKKVDKSVLAGCKTKFNVLMLGIDSMSLPRAGQVLPKTVKLFQRFNWNGYRGYHKVGDNTFPNLMAVLTGKNLTSVEKECSGRMDSCNKQMIWSRFRDAGYVTAYGEDNLQLPDTFKNEYEFNISPTDHYMRPFFLKGEYQHESSTFLCLGKVCSGKHILDYALDFAFTYKMDSFFGLFWINSFSHDAESRPHEADVMLETFFYKLARTGVMSNTFIIFFSDHGVRFGGDRYKMEAYYDDRLPMFFMWVPIMFKEAYPINFASILSNQFRLVTPYDIFSTLLHIRLLSLCSNTLDDPPEGCPKCQSTLITIKPTRVCHDVAISAKWCSCHKLYPLTSNTTEGKQVVALVVNHITSRIKTIKTKRCWGCLSLSIKTIYRVHFYYAKDNINMYYVVAFSMTPGNTSYEATVFQKNYESQGTVVGPISFISGYRGLGKCTLKKWDRLFCVCQKIANC